MGNLNSWLSEYSKSHQHKTNERIHWICVPLITFSFLGLLWSIPIPDAFTSVAYLNYATLFCALCLFFYLRLGIRVAVFISIPILFMLWGISILAKGDYLLAISAVIFVISWLVQFWGHKIEKKKPSFLEASFFS